MGCGNSKPEAVKSTTLPAQETPFTNSEVDQGLQSEMKGSNNNSKQNVAKVEITVESLQTYLEQEKRIRNYEKRHVLESFQIKSDQLEQLEQKIEELEVKSKQQEEETSRIKSLLDEDGQKSLKQFLIEKGGQPNIQLTEEQQELTEALNRQEMVKRELVTTVQQRNSLREEVQKLGKECEELQRLTQQRDEFLDNLFGGAYGSETENRLEKEFDLLKERKQHVDQAYFKWRQAHMMVKQACAQMGYAYQKWRELGDMDESENEKRYYTAAEVRNNLLAAIQNVQGAQRCLPNINFPYCAPEEMETLNKAITYVFTDMQTAERHKHALECYNTTYRRAGALRQWFEQVLNTTISKDLAEVTEECKCKGAELRRERVNLIRLKVKEITGRDVDMETDSAIDSEADEMVADEQIAQIFEADRVDGKKGMFLMPDARMAPLPTPLPTTDLAPMPTNEEIFGKIDELRRRHAAEMEDFEKAQTVNRARMVQGLQEKLQARRNRRSRMQMHSRELAAIQSR